jgi:uncharacterized protein (TIGR01777 family)
MRILVSGSTGLVGTALIPKLAREGHDVVRLVRSQSAGPSKDTIAWDPNARFVDAAGLEGLDAVIHLAGEPIAGGRWTARRKARIRESRVQGTRLLCEAFSHTARPPSRFLCASAIGYYGNRGDEVLTEASTSGDGFLADVCREWEAAADPLRQKGIRVVNLRFGVILSARGGALAKMLTPFKLGVAGIVGSGRQYMSCIALDDCVAAIQHAVATDSVQGPVNVVGPVPVTNSEFTKTLGRVLGRPTVLPMPAFAARLAFGEMADELLLASTRVEPRKLQESGFQFRHAGLEDALRSALAQ